MDYVISSAMNEDVEDLKSLWQACFPDDDAYIDFYFNNCFLPSRVRVIRSEGRVVCMVHVLPAKLVMASREYDCAYVYAVATLPQERGKGLMSILLENCEDYAKKQGLSALVLVPSTPSLFEFYKKLGYKIFTDTYFASSVVSLPIKRTSFFSISADQYGEMRKNAPYFRPIFVWDGEMQRYCFDELGISGYTVEGFECGSKNGAVVYKLSGKELSVKELIADKDIAYDVLMQKAIDLDAQRVTARLSASLAKIGLPCEKTPFSMIKPLQKMGRIGKNGYVNIVMD